RPVDVSVLGREPEHVHCAHRAQALTGGLSCWRLCLPQIGTLCLLFFAESGIGEALSVRETKRKWDSAGLGARSGAAAGMTRPDRARDAGFQAVEAEVAVSAELGDVEDLPRVHAEVLHRVIDRLQRRDGATLHRAAVVEPGRIGPRKYRVRFQHRRGEYRHELVPRDWVPPSELGAAIADVGHPADAAHDPL